MSVYLLEKFDIGEDDPSLLGKKFCCNFIKY